MTESHATPVSEISGLSPEEQDEFDWYSALRIERGLNATWSISGIKDFNEVPFPKVDAVVYRGVEYVVPPDVRTSLSWFDLWKIADQLMRTGQGYEHYFIESFDPIPERPNVYSLETGS